MRQRGACAGLLAGLAVFGVSAGVSTAASPHLMTWAEFYARPFPRPQLTVAYGALPQQVAELWLPDRPGPHRVVVLIHGGCWTKSVADLKIMHPAAEALRQSGLAVWNVEYRGVDEPGGGYPGTYQDIGAAIDRLREEAPRHGLQLDRLVVVGHSAGGQLALWSAGRRKLPPSSPLHVADPLAVHAVVDLAGIADLQRDLRTACGAGPVRAMAGPERPGGRYADTSPADMLPLGVYTIVMHGSDDKTVPPVVGEAYAARASAAGDPVVVLHSPGGHVEEIAPGSPAWIMAERGVFLSAVPGSQ